jgi:uncharacterized membrane protein YvlD (DUF360 family)
MFNLPQGIRVLVRLLFVWFVDTISVWVTAKVTPGISITPTGDVTTIGVAAAAALLIGIVNLLVRPLILLLALPLGFFVIFAVGFLVNAVVLLITSALMPAFAVSGLLPAVVGGIILSAVNTIITTMTTIDDDDSFYQGVVERLAARQKFAASGAPGRGLLMIELDGLSYWRLKDALSNGYMPTLAAKLGEGWALSRVDCGLPSQTSACQAGIMFGDNHDIPAFRWYDKEKKKLYVSGSDAAILQKRFSTGNGLMHGGSSINNMLNGDAEKSVLTLGDLKSGTPEEKKRRADDIYLLMLNPYFMMRTIVLMFGDALTEMKQGWEQKRAKVEPRMDRMHKAYPIVRAAANVFTREISVYLMMLDIVRGTPVLYTTWPGYDEVAHHSGPATKDAYLVLKDFDRLIARILDFIERKAPRQYEVVLLSDHGQSFGATFKMRYGKDLKTFVQDLLPAGTTMATTIGGDDGTIALAAMAGEMDNIQEQDKGGRIGKAVVGGAGDALRKGVDDRNPALAAEPTNVIACGSGNIAMVYFDREDRKLTMNEINASYPQVLPALVAHEGVGFVVTYDDSFAPIMLGKGGQRNLHTGEVTGADPLFGFGDVTLRAAQVRRVADYPHAGDLIVNSPIYPDGTVAAMEELIGNHGGLGGEQTDAFMMHPSDMAVPETANAADFYTILMARRGLPEVPPQPAKVEAEKKSDWALGTLWQGIRNVGEWLPKVPSALALNRETYRTVANGAMYTGPAMIVAIAGMLATELFGPSGATAYSLIARFVAWVLTVAFVYIGARFLGGKGTFTKTFRVMGFAHAGYILQVLGILPVVGPLVRLAAVLLAFFGVWVGVSEANELRGWRSVLLPLGALLAAGIIIFAVRVLGLGVDATLQQFAAGLGAGISQ